MKLIVNHRRVIKFQFVVKEGRCGVILFSKKMNLYDIYIKMTDDIFFTFKEVVDFLIFNENNDENNDIEKINILCEVLKCHKSNLFEYYEISDFDLYKKFSFFVEAYIERFSVEMYSFLKEFSDDEIKKIKEYISTTSSEDSFYSELLECKEFMKNYSF